MKKLVVFALFLLVFAGCQQENDLTGPVTESSTQVSDWESAAKSQGLQFISLPQQEGMKLSKQNLTDTELVTVTGGGNLFINYSYKDANGKNVSVVADLAIRPYSVKSDVELTMGFSDEDLSAYVELAFGPSSTSFLKPALLNVAAKGLDLSMLSPTDKLKLMYWDPDEGLWKEVKAGFIYFNIQKGVIFCVNGELPHFSRYGFTR